MDKLRNHPLYREHNVDSMMSSLWEFYKKRFVALFLISFIMTLVIQYISTFVNIQQLAAITDPEEMLAKMSEMIIPILAISLVNLFLNAVMQHYVIFNPVDPGNSILLSVAGAVRIFIPYLIIMILLAFAGSFAILLGLVVLIVGVFFSVLYILTIYLFILPVMMSEGINIGQTISRTLSLVHRNFWSNIGWVAVIIIILLVVSVITSGIILLPFTGSFVKTIMNPAEATEIINLTKNPVFIVLSALAGALTFPVLPVFSCILYFNGKAREEKIAAAMSSEPVTDRVRVEDLYAKPYSDDHPDNPENKEKSQE